MIDRPTKPMRRNRLCEEIVKGNGKEYLLSGTIGNIESLALTGEDPSFLFAKLADGMLPPKAIRNTIACTLVLVDGVPVESLNLDDEVDEFVDSFGLQDCSLLARRLINHAIIGTVKKKQIERQEKVEGMFRKLPSFLSTSSARAGLLWVALLIASVTLACTIFR